MKFIIDTQLPPLLKELMVSKGYDTSHTIDYPKGVLIKDVEIREIALVENRVIITKDKDFLDMYLVKGSPPKVVLIELGNCKNSLLLSYFRRNLDQIIKSMEKSDLGLLEWEVIRTF